MKRFSVLGLLPLLLLGALCLAEDDRDVSWKARDEIARRGPLVERIDGFHGAADSPLGDVLSPPADDSHKFYITLVLERGNKACDQLRWDFENKLRGWANPRDYQKSWSHFQVVQIEDKTQDWRWANYRPKKFPTIIVQPPFNESWGDPHTVIFSQEGYSQPEDLDKKMRAAFMQFAKVAQPARTAWQHKQAGGVFKQSGGFEQAGGWTPPVAPVAPLGPPQQTFPPELNPVPTPAAPQPATAAELQVACPGASAEFVLSLLTRKATKEEAASLWAAEQQQGLMKKLQQQFLDAMEKLKNPPPPAPVPEPKVEPKTEPATSTLLDIWMKLVAIFAGGTVTMATGAALVGYGIKGILYLRKKKVDAGITPTINDALAKRLDLLDDYLIAYGQRKQAQAAKAESPS